MCKISVRGSASTSFKESEYSVFLAGEATVRQLEPLPLEIKSESGRSEPD